MLVFVFVFVLLYKFVYLLVLMGNFGFWKWGFVVLSLGYKGLCCFVLIMRTMRVNLRFGFRNFVYFWIVWIVNYELGLRNYELRRFVGVCLLG